MKRRHFLKRTGLAAVSFGIWPGFLEQELFAATEGKTSKVLVLIFQRGAMDGLSMVPPLGDPNYLRSRPNIALRPGSAKPPLPLEDGFALHPALSPLKKHWDEGRLAFIHQVGSHHSTRSHFDAQDYMEAGTPGDKNTEEGFLNRAMKHIREGKPSSIRAVALQPTMPRILQGPFPAISMASLKDFRIPASRAGEAVAEGFEDMYRDAADKVFRGVGGEAFDALRVVKTASESREGQESYPKSKLARSLAEISQLIKSEVGLQVAVAESGGWDTHVRQGAHEGQIAQRFKELGDAIAAFADDLGPTRMSDVCLVTITEFGRTVKENGNGGTDHGHGSAMMVMGGGIIGKRVYGKWKDLSPANLFEGRDVPVITDYRDVLGEILRKHMAVKDLAAVFPKFRVREAQWLRLFGV